jgi:ceramide glucosyltransferase
MPNVDVADFAAVALVVGGVGLLLNLVGQLAAHVKWSARAGRGAGFAPELGVSILKPIKGLDEGLHENLASLARQDYGSFEILVAIEDALDPAIPVVRRVQREFPDVAIDLVVRRNRAGCNPKVNNLLGVLPLARYPLLLISDSNVRVGADYLRQTTQEMADARVGLVSNLIRVVGGGSLGSRLERQHFHTFVVSGVCLGDRVGIPTVIGKSMMLRREALAAVGGLEAVRDVLAEDYVLGSRIQEAGWRVALSAYAVHNVNGDWTLGRFFARHQRWAQLRRWVEPAAFAVELFSFAGLWLLVAGGLGLAAGRPDLAATALAGFTVLAASDALVTARIVGRAELDFLLRPLREICLLGAWLCACFKREVVWRGNRMRIGPGTVLRPVEEAAHVHRPA